MEPFSTFRLKGQQPPGKLRKEAPALPIMVDAAQEPGRRHKRTGSTREALSDLMRRLKGTPTSPHASSHKAKSEPIQPTHVVSNSPPGSGRLLSPQLPVDANKPLPSPPPPGTIDKADGVQPVRILKLQRIMASLTDTEVEKLFSGAPQFFARSQGVGTGAPFPSAAFPWDEDLGIRDLTDHTHIEDDAWGCVTALPRIILRDPLSTVSPTSRARPHFNARCRERPNMLSMQGLEKGTIGYQAALELPISDALQEEQYGFNNLGAKANVVRDARERLFNPRDGIRRLDDTAVMEHLLKCEERYVSDRRELRLRPQELYDDLFVTLLHPPSRSADPKDPASLAAQINALVKVLAKSNIWIDFSHVEWRIRLGQIIWGFPLDDEIRDESTMREGGDAHERAEERFWLLVQILLACELLVRLDAITDGNETGGEVYKASEVHKFEKEANASVKWSLVLARTWLENITITKSETQPSGASTPKSWLTSLTSKFSITHDHMHGAFLTDYAQHRRQSHAVADYTYSIKGKYNERQLFGLTQFARKLRWPDIEAYVTRVSIQAPTFAEATPLNASMHKQDPPRAPVFDNSKRPESARRNPSRRPNTEAVLHPSGSLSRSFVAGLVLPGEGLSHLLMSSLLENDQDALAKLGPVAHLCGGFVYSGKSFWSTACIVGRVLAAGRGSAECMGWVSADVLPQGLEYGWVNVKVEGVADDLAQSGKKARIWGKTVIERESNVIGDADPANVLPADFIIPQANAYSERPPANIRIELKSLHLQPVPAGSPDASPSPASIAFTMTHDGLEQERELICNLSKDVYFVTAHPCVASSRVRLFKSPTSPTIQQIDVGGKDWNGKTSSPAHVTGHPLHKYYKHTAIHLTELLKRPDTSLDEVLGVTSHNNGSGRSSLTLQRGPQVLVIDCITGFAPPRSPDLPALSRMSSLSSSFGLEPTYVQMKQSVGPVKDADSSKHVPAPLNRPGTAGSGAVRIDPPPVSPRSKMQLPTRRRQFGSDLEVLVRAVCAERGWNALISRRRRGCLACAIREAGALGWRVVVRVE